MVGDVGLRLGVRVDTVVILKGGECGDMEIEADCERLLLNECKRIGVYCDKLITPGRVGSPDRKLILPGGWHVYVELKSPTGRLSEIQKVEKRRLEKQGCEVHVLRGRDEVREFIGELERRIKDARLRERMERKLEEMGFYDEEWNG